MGERDGTGHPLVDRYVRLALRLDRVVPGVLDAHLGDPGVARSVAGEHVPDPRALAREAEELRDALPTAGLDRQREAFLAAQLTACRALAGLAAGERMRFTDEVAACYDVRIAPGDPDRYRAAHRELDALLPGRGTLRRRLSTFRTRDRVPADRLAVAVRALLEALRARTADTVGLPGGTGGSGGTGGTGGTGGEDVTVEVVDDAPWSGFSRRTGPARSTVVVNAGATHRAPQLALLVAHEAYPGHHTEHVLLEQRPDPEERAVLLARTPQSLVAEGAAELGLDVVVGPGWGRWAAKVLAGVGVRVDEELAVLGEAVEAAMGGLAGVRQDAALLLHEHGATPGEVVDHLCRWLLVDAERARRMLAFLSHPRWRTHTTTYVEGVRLVGPWLAARDPDEPLPARFTRLLSEPWTPSTLRS